MKKSSSPTAPAPGDIPREIPGEHLNERLEGAGLQAAQFQDDAGHDAGRILGEIVESQAQTQASAGPAKKGPGRPAGSRNIGTTRAPAKAQKRVAQKQGVQKAEQVVDLDDGAPSLMPASQIVEIVAKGGKPAMAAKRKPVKKVAPVRVSRNPVKLRANVDVRDLDLTLPMDKRPILGSEIESWRNMLRLNRVQAQQALGLNTISAYAKMVESNAVLPFSTELLFRLYLLSPKAPGWDRYTFRELFDELYRDELMKFKGDQDMARSASVLLAERFTMLFYRSKTRAYQWFAEDRDETTVTAYADIETILCKLKSLGEERPDLGGPAQVFEQVSIECWRLRGHDFNSHFPVPTMESMAKKKIKISKAPASSSSTSLWAMLKDSLHPGDEVEPVEVLEPASSRV